MAPTKPVKEIRRGRTRAAIWGNQTKDNKVWFNVTISRLYKEADKWKDAESFGRDDLLHLGKVANLAYDWICEQEAAHDSDETAE
jgi:hypothetical protein